MKDISKIPSSATSDDDIDINKVTNSGADTDRDNLQNNEPAPQNTDTGKEASTPANNPPTPPQAPSNTPNEEGAEGEELKQILSSFSGNELNDEDTALKTQLLTKFKGTNFNENGDIINDNGEVVAEVADVLKSLDDDATTVNENGDLVDLDGKVIKTKAELAVENSVVNKLHSELEYEFLDEQGKPKIYSDDAKGFQELADDLANYRLEDFKSTFFTQHPELAEVSKHLLSGGTLETFKEPVDYSKIDVKGLDKAQKLGYIRQSFKAGGMADTRINAMIKRIEDSNEIDAETEEAIADLTIRDKEAKKQRDAQYKQSIAEQNERVEQYWNQVEDTVKQGKLANLEIPEKDKQAFVDYLSRPVDNKGNSKEMLDASKETLDQKLAFAYIRYKGYKLDELIDAKARTKTVLSLKERIQRSAKLKPTPANDTGAGITSGKNKDISIDQMLS